MPAFDVYMIQCESVIRHINKQAPAEDQKADTNSINLFLKAGSDGK